MIRAVFVLVVLGVACSQMPGPCVGCLDSKGVCQPGTEVSACGMFGNSCAVCPSLSTCTAQACRFIDMADGGGAGGGSGGGGGGAGGGGGTVDAGNTYVDGGSRSRFWDGGSCSVKTECPCFSSDDCAPSFFCHSEDTTGTKVFCVPGTRGDGGVGARCATEAECQSALCIDASDGGTHCSGLCDVAAECAPALPRCLYIGFGIDRSICSP